MILGGAEALAGTKAEEDKDREEAEADEVEEKEGAANDEADAGVKEAAPGTNSLTIGAADDDDETEGTNAAVDAEKVEEEGGLAFDEPSRASAPVGAEPEARKRGGKNERMNTQVIRCLMS